MARKWAMMRQAAVADGTTAKNKDGNELLMLILGSKRLLSDHVDIIELCLSDTLGDRVNKYGHRNTMIKCSIAVAATIITTTLLDRRWKIIRCTVPAVATAYVGGVAWSKFGIFAYYKQLRHLKVLVTKLDFFDVCIRRNINYYREITHLRASSVFVNKGKNDHSITFKNIQSIILVTRVLYEAVRKLELHSLPSAYENIYQPMEDLNNCEYFRKSLIETDVGNIKDFYNIFLYLQSQLLTRLGLQICYNNKSANDFITREIPSIIVCLNEQISSDNNAHNLLTSNTELEQRLETIKQRVTTTSTNNITETISIIRGYSLSFISRLLAVADEYRNLDNIIQSVTETSLTTASSRNKQDLIDLIDPIKQFENSLALCQDDYQRLTVAYHKFIYLKYNVKAIDDVNPDTETELYMAENKDLGQVNQELPTVEEAEFYAALDRAAEDPPTIKNSPKSAKSFDDKLREIDSKAVKKHFKPVLKQLKDKIGPINKSMRDRERKYLLAQGILKEEDLADVQINDGDDDVNGNDNGSDSEYSTPSARRKVATKRNNYDDMRQFLQEKQQIGFLPLAGMPKLLLDEDILE